jgi:undecaprenyl pyrophosphate phosphatase UppP
VPREGLPAIIQGLKEWLPRSAKGETFLPIHVVKMEKLNLYHFPNDVLMCLGFLARIPVSLNWMQ